MKLTDEKKDELKSASLESAVSLLDDLAYIRTLLLKNEITPGEIRRLSAQLRRILVERDLAKIASPRVGRLHINAPDTKPFVVSNRSNPIPFFCAGGLEIFGVSIACGLIDRSTKLRDLGEYSPDRRISIRIEGFLKQAVICFEGNWITRNDVIKYIANVAEGVHSGEPRSETERLIRRSRHVWSAKLNDAMPVITGDITVLSVIELPAIVDREKVDCALIEVLATASHLVNSPEVQILEKQISTEIGA